MIIVKKLSGAASWAVGHIAATFDYYANLNATDQFYDNDGYWSDDAPTSSVFTLGSDGLVNTNAQNYIAYVFAPVKGFSKFSKWIGNGNVDGPFVYTGFRPSFIIFKSATTGYGWYLMDVKRNPYNIVNNYLYANAADAQGTHGFMDINSNGFKIREAGVGSNTIGDTFIYAAFAEFPFVSSNSKPGTAR